MGSENLFMSGSISCPVGEDEGGEGLVKVIAPSRSQRHRMYFPFSIRRISASSVILLMRAAAVAPPATPPMMMILMCRFVFRVSDFDYTQPPDALHQEC